MLGGYISDRLSRRHVGWYLGLSGIANLLAVPFGAIFTLTGNLYGVFICYLLTVAFNASSAAAVAAVSQALVQPNMRAMSFSTQYMITSLIGMGGGPLLVGLGNDLLDPYLGAEAVRYSLLVIVTTSSFLCGGAFLMGSRTMSADMPDARLAQARAARAQ